MFECFLNLPQSFLKVSGFIFFSLLQMKQSSWVVMFHLQKVLIIFFYLKEGNTWYSLHLENKGNRRNSEVAVVKYRTLGFVVEFLRFQ